MHTQDCATHTKQSQLSTHHLPASFRTFLTPYTFRAGILQMGLGQQETPNKAGWYLVTQVEDVRVSGPQNLSVGPFRACLIKAPAHMAHLVTPTQSRAFPITHAHFCM